MSTIPLRGPQRAIQAETFTINYDAAGSANLTVQFPEIVLPVGEEVLEAIMRAPLGVSDATLDVVTTRKMRREMRILALKA